MCAILYLCVHLTYTRLELRRDGERKKHQMRRGRHKDAQRRYWLWALNKSRLALPSQLWAIFSKLGHSSGRQGTYELQLVPVLAPEGEFQHQDPHVGYHCVLFLAGLLAEGLQGLFSFLLTRHLLILSRSRETSCGTLLHACQMLL